MLTAAIEENQYWMCFAMKMGPCSRDWLPNIEGQTVLRLTRASTLGEVVENSLCLGRQAWIT